MNPLFQDDRRFRKRSSRTFRTGVIFRPLENATKTFSLAVKGMRIKNEFTTMPNEKYNPNCKHEWRIILCDLVNDAMHCLRCGRQVIIDCCFDKSLGID